MLDITLIFYLYQFSSWVLLAETPFSSYFLFFLLYSPYVCVAFFFFLFFLLSFGDQRVEYLFLPPNSYIFLLPIFYLHPSFLLLFLYSLNGRVVGYLMSDVLFHPFPIPDFEQL